MSIVDVKSSHRPIYNEDGSIRIVFYGEIYDHADRRARLELQRHIFATHCNTETVVHDYEQRDADSTRRSSASAT